MRHAIDPPHPRRLRTARRKPARAAPWFALAADLKGLQPGFEEHLLNFRLKVQRAGMKGAAPDAETTALVADLKSIAARLRAAGA